MRELVSIPDDLDEEDSGGTAAAEPKENLELM